MPECPKCPPPGAPAWLLTFADLMSLLMCFFVMLLSMASMDVVKFKAVVESLSEAFGAQREIHVDQNPMGTSIVEHHFSPGDPKPTVTEEIKQSSQEQSETLDASPISVKAAQKKVLEAKLQEIRLEAKKIGDVLKDEINQGQVTVDTNSFRITIRINEKGSFPSASAMLQKGFEPVMDKIGEAVAKTRGKIIIAGHTDDVPIKTAAYRSNWELSSARALTIAHYILDKKRIDPMRLLIESYADTKPLKDNNSPEARALNRRVEIVIAQDLASLLGVTNLNR
jgi:chemotaxis protein MotB